MEEAPSSGVTAVPKKSGMRGAEATSHIPVPVRKLPHSISPLVSSVGAKDIAKKSAHTTDSHIPLPNRRPQSPLHHQSSSLRSSLKLGAKHQTGGDRFRGSAQGPLPQNRVKMSESTPSSSLTSITPSSASTGSLSGTPLRHAIGAASSSSSISANSLSLGSYSPARTGLTSSSSSPITSPSRIPQRYAMPTADSAVPSSVRNYSTIAAVSSSISSIAQSLTFTTSPSRIPQRFTMPIHHRDSSTAVVSPTSITPTDVSPNHIPLQYATDSPSPTSLSISNYSSAQISPSSSSPRSLVSPVSLSSPPHSQQFKTSATSSTDNSYFLAMTASTSIATYSPSSCSNINSSAAKSTPSFYVAQSPVVSPRIAMEAGEEDCSTLEVNSTISSEPSSPQRAPLAKAMTEASQKAAEKLLHDEAQNLADTAMAKKADDSEMKRNLLSMISKSQDKKRKTRALPNLQALKSPTKSAESRIRAPSESLPSTSGGSLMLPDSLPLDGDESADNLLPLSPMETLKSRKSLDGQLEIGSLPTFSLGVEKTETGAVLKHESPVNTPPAMESLQLPILSTPSSGAAVSDASLPPAADDNTKLAGFASETVMQQLLPEDGSSSSDFEVRNEVPLGQEMETKRDQYPQPVFSDDSVDGSANSIVSDRSLPTALGHVSDATSRANLEDVATTSLPDLDGQYKADQNPGDLLHKLQLSTLRGDKESVELKLQQAEKRIASLEVENMDLVAKLGQATAQVRTLKGSVEREQQMTAELSQKHAEEVRQIKKEMREQLNAERERLLNQIRELTVMKEHKRLEVDELKSSLSEAHELATSSTSNLERSEVKHQTEMENMKIEMQALQELYDETERSHSNLLKSSKDTEERIDELLSENKMLQQKMETLEDSTTERSIKLKLRAAEEHINQLQSEKSRAVFAIEQKVAQDSIKMQVKHREVVELLQRQLADAKAKLSAQEQRTTAQLTNTHPDRSGQIWPVRDQSKTAPAAPVSARYLGDTIAFKNKRHGTMPHLKKHAATGLRPSSASKGEMDDLVAALEKEGYEMASQETTEHLLKMLEQAKKELKQSRNNWQKERGRREELEMANKRLTLQEVNAKSNQEVLKHKLETMLHKSHVADEQTSSMRRKQEEVLSENQELKGKLIDLRSRLMDKSVQLNNLEASLAGTKREASFTQKELSIEKHQKNVLESKVAALEDQVFIQKKEMKDLKGDAKEKLTSAGDHVRQTRHEVANLKSKIGELEGEVTLLKQQLSHATEQRETLQGHLDSLTSQVTLMETQLHRERAKSIDAQAKLEELEGETSYKGVELKREKGHCAELQSRISTTRNSLDIANHNVSSLEAELRGLRTEHSNCHNELSRTTRFATEIETKLQYTTSELTRFQELAAKLQDTITVTQSELESTTISLEMERQTNKELQSMIEALSGNLERSGKQMEAVDVHFNSTKRELAEKRLSLQSTQEENHSLKMEMRHGEAARVSLETELDNSQRKLETKNLALIEATNTMSSLENELADAHSEIDAYRIQVEDFQSRLKSNEFENSRLSKDQEINEIEMQSVMLNVKMTSKQLEEIKAQLEQKEEHLRWLQQEKMRLTSELTEYKREVQSLSALKAELENDIELKSSELEVEHSRGEKMSHDVQRKNEALKSLESEVEKLQHSLICEKEHTATLGMEQSTLAEQLQKAREQKRHLEAELERCMEEYRAKSEHDQMVISKLKREISHTAEQLETLSNQYTLLDADSQHYKQMVDSSNVQLAKLKSALSKANCTLESTSEAKDNLQKQLEITQQQLDGATSSLSYKITEHEQTCANLTVCQSQLMDTLQKAEKLQENLKAEKACNLKVQGDFERVGDALMTVKLDLERIKEQDAYNRKKAESLSSEITLYQTKNQQLTRDLEKAQNELAQVKEVSAETRASFSHNTNMMRASFKEEKESWKIENEALEQEQLVAKRQLSSLEDQLDSYESKLQETNAKLIMLEEKCAQQKSELLEKDRLETHSHHLESAQAAAKAELSDLKKRLASQIAETHRLERELEGASSECTSLKDKLQYQRETAATSLNRIQKQSQEKSSELHSKIQELSENIKQAHISLRKAQQEVARVKSEKETLSLCVNEETERNQMLREQLQDTKMELKLLEEEVSVVRKSNADGKNKMAELEQVLSEEMLRRQDCEACFQEQRETLASTTQELLECKNVLTKECSTNRSLKKELNQFKNDLSQAKNQVDDMRSIQKKAQQRGEIEMATMRQKYHGEKKALKEKVRDLQAELDITITKCRNQGDEASQLAAANKSLMESHNDAVKEASQLEGKLQEKKQECNCLKIKLQATELQVTQLQVEIAAIERAQLKVSEHQKKADVRAKREMQKVLAEVTEHMEQQYSAHRYLEKLRTENEAIVLKEKERAISKLKDDLKVKKQENKQDKLRLEQVQLETSFFKSQQKDQDRSRRRLESRLDQVNETLSRTMPQPCNNPLHTAMLPTSVPLYTSTPSTHRTRFSS